MSETDKQLLSYQTTLVGLQREIIKRRLQVLIVLEGRDASGKDGCAKRVLQYLSPRESRVVALSVPSEIEINQWYFRRHVDQLPQFGELVVFNRSWYNRAGVEHVMGYCSQQQLKEFIELAPLFELLLIRSGFIVLKYYLDISKQEQEARLLERANSPLKRWKFSAVDAVAVEKWDLYSTACGSYPSERGDFASSLREGQRAHERDLWGRSDLDRVAEAWLRLGTDFGKVVQGSPQSQRSDHGPTRADQLA